MNRSRYENRARWLSQNYRTRQGKHEVLPTSMLPGDYWEQKVKSRDDIVTYYQMYHPEMPDELIRALAEHIDLAVKGERKLEDHWYTSTAKGKLGIQEDPQHKPWDFLADIEQERQIAVSTVQPVDTSEQNWQPKEGGEEMENPAEQ